MTFPLSKEAADAEEYDVAITKSNFLQRLDGLEQCLQISIALERKTLRALSQGIGESLSVIFVQFCLPRVFAALAQDR